MFKNIKLAITMAAFSLVGCSDASFQSTSHENLVLLEQYTNSLAEMFKDGDIQKVNEWLFDGHSMFAESEEAILERIFPYVDINLLHSNEELFQIEVTAPNMSNLFLDMIIGSAMDIRAMDIAELLNYIEYYITNIDSQYMIVNLSYIVDNGSVLVDFSTPDFMTAITGKLFEAYVQLYLDALA
ncbi:MAG: hypothetical protein BEN18_09645 [Epulopiscium sp. Nuni2H_MBin001]|nr:MAG: hypothetical protein BEN18_09645 [Epulopiscium sp. Nuni2H_MBin001]